MLASRCGAGRGFSACTYMSLSGEGSHGVHTNTFAIAGLISTVYIYYFNLDWNPD